MARSPAGLVELFAPRSDLLQDFSFADFPSRLLGWHGPTIDLDAGATHYGYIASGNAEIEFGDYRYPLSAGMYFCVPHAMRLVGNGTGFIASRIDYRGLFQLGGPVESTGRLRYIDGCRDTLLIGPPVIGDPCLNLLHIPPDTRQTSHTHPSERLGMIAAGRGVCKTLSGDLQLEPGMIFSIESEGVHSFNTNDESLLVIAWHPDSDCGPSHEDHPMINRTIIDGISASTLATKGELNR